MGKELEKENFTIFFIRHGKLLLPYKDHSEMPFGILADLASEKLNPPINKDFAQSLIVEISDAIPFAELETIYSSPARRCQETAALIADFIKQKFGRVRQVTTIQELEEIDFDLSKICVSRDSSRLEIETVNNAVFAAMASGENCEPVLETYKRVGSVFSTLNSLAGTSKSLLVTHDFIMRVIEIYIKNHGQDKAQITEDELRRTKRNLYLRGFATDFLLRAFSPF